MEAKYFQWENISTTPSQQGHNNNAVFILCSFHVIFVFMFVSLHFRVHIHFHVHVRVHSIFVFMFIFIFSFVSPETIATQINMQAEARSIARW